MGKIEIFKLEDRVLFEAAAVAEIVEAMDNDPNANMNETDRQAQEEKDAIKNAPPENPADAAYAQEGAKQPDEVADIDGEIQKLIDGEIAFSDAGAQAVDDAINGVFGDFGANAVEDAIHDAMRTEPVEMELYHSDEYITTDRELVIINSSVAGKDEIISSLGSNQEVLILDGEGDAMAQINEYLENSGVKYDAIHFVTHGNEGYFILNNESVGADNFDAEAWSTVGDYVTDNGDILIYGCNLAGSESGQDLVAMIADATGADVAASTNMTGIGGDWALEYQLGNIEAVNISVEGYNYRLTDWTVTLSSDDGSSSGSDYELRHVIENKAISGDSISFRLDNTDTITLNSQLVIIQHELTINGTNTGTGLSGVAGDSVVTVQTNGGDFHLFEANDAAADWDLTFRKINLIGNQNSGTTIDGGAIYVNGANVELTLNDVNISDSHAARGGAIAVTAAGENLTININDSTFTGNKSGNGATSTDGGGAIYARATNTSALTALNININGTSAFSNNSSAGWGGAITAISAYNLNINIDGIDALNQVVFDANQALGGCGGAIFAQGTGGVTDISIDYATIDGNTATGGGGAIYLIGGSSFFSYTGRDATIDISNSTFSNNKVTQSDNSTLGGGAIGATHERISIFTVTDSKFSDNVASRSGGAIYIADNTSPGAPRVSTEMTLTNTDFTGNDAGIWGGAIYITGNMSITGGKFNGNSAGDLGGAIRLNSYTSGVDGTLTVTGATFDLNVAGSNGGAISASTVHLENSTFTNNRVNADSTLSVYGGAVDGKGTLKGTILFENNHLINISGGARGGAIRANTLTIESGAEVSFINNSATGSSLAYGGAIYGTTLTIEDGADVSFVDNKAVSSGGDAVGGAIVTLDDLSLTNVYFEGNSAQYGGAIYSAYEITIDGSTFKDNIATVSGGAIYAVGVLNITNGTFTGNTVVNTTAYDTEQQRGGAVYAGGNVTIKGNTSFINNAVTCHNQDYEDIGGGAVYAVADLIIDGTVSFEGNYLVSGGAQAAKGGAIYVGGEANITGAEFTGNHVNHNISGNPRGDGGAIYSAGKLTIDDAAFTGNHSNISGGAIYANGELYIDNAEFYGNFSGDGGAILINDKAVIGNSIFGDGTDAGANYASGQGGAIVILNGATAIDLTLNDVVFNKNHAVQSGGAIAIENSNINDIKLTIGGTSKFTDNYVVADGYGAFGGAIYMWATADDAEALIDINGKTDFENNRAYVGGAIFVWDMESDRSNYTVNIGTEAGSIVNFTNNDASGVGGGAYFTFNSTSTIGIGTGSGAKVSFEGNTAVDQTGALYIRALNASDTAIGAGTRFIDNQAGAAGALFFGGHKDAVLTIGENGSADGQVLFSGNKATGTFGGAIVATSTVRIYNTHFEDNEAATNGGAIYLYSIYNGNDLESSLYVDNSEFEGNVATVSGGAIYAIGNSLSVSGSNFSRNSANMGGAIYSNKGFTVTGSTFTENWVTGANDALTAGGAIAVETTEAADTLTITGSTFTGNYTDTASRNNRKGGAIYYSQNSTTDGATGTINIDGTSKFDGNTSDYYGGAIYAISTYNIYLNITGTDANNHAVFEGNTAKFGGGIYIHGEAGETNLAIDYATFSENKAIADGSGGTGSGGAIIVGDPGSYYSANANSTGNISIKNSLFEDNAAGSKGGAIFVTHYAMDQFTIDNTEFDGNTASGTGGAIFLKKHGSTGDPNGDLIITNSEFYSNASTGDRGGAIHTDSNISVSDSQFGDTGRGNTAGDSGGAIFVNTNDASVSFERTVFTGNKAGASGGAVFTFSYASTFKDVTFTGNAVEASKNATGGAIYSRFRANIEGTSVFNGNYVSLTGNYTAGGGAISTLSVLRITGDDVSFTDNYAVSTEGTSYGGAIYSHTGYYAAVPIIISGTANFTGNYAASGGAIAVVMPGYHSILNITGEANFNGNKATAGNGGAIYISGPSGSYNGTDLQGNLSITGEASFDSNTAAGRGGAIYVTAVNASTVDILNSTFTGNTAGVDGGAIWTAATVTVTIGTGTAADGAYFYGNSAVNGGAIFAEGALTVSDSTFGKIEELSSGNTATGDGGAIYAKGTLTVSDSIFRHGRVDGNGGAIYAVGALTVSGGTFGWSGYSAENKATIGGAIYANGTLDLTDSNFYWNNASKMGGAIYAGGDLTIGGTGIFYYNNVRTFAAGADWDVYGGAIYAAGNLEIGGSITFENNQAYAVRNHNSYGGAIYVLGTAEITEAKFSSNSATYHYETPDSSHGMGGAIYASSKLTLTDTIFNYNSASDSGGAIYARADVSISGGRFERNRAGISRNSSSYGTGGAIHIEQGGASESVLTVTGDTEFRFNSAAYQGGAIYASGSVIHIGSNDKTDGSAIFDVNYVVSGSYTESRSHVAGGAIYTDGELNVHFADFTGNYANAEKSGGSALGGAIYAGGNTTIHHSVFAENYTIVERQIIPARMAAGISLMAAAETISAGGAIYNTGNLVVHDTTFYNNAARGSRGDNFNVQRRGGAIYNAGTAVVYNSTFYRNYASPMFYDAQTVVNESQYNQIGQGYGGAIYNSGDLTLADVTFAANYAMNEGGAIYNLGTAVVLNTLMVGNIYSIHTYSDANAEWTLTRDYNDFVTYGEFNMAYSIYSAGTGTVNGFANVVADSATALDSIFGAEWDFNHLVFKGTSDDVLVNGTIAIKNTGLAAYKGTLVGQKGDHFYYRNMETGKWASFTDKVSDIDFVETNTVDFGLTGGDIIKFGQNYPASRIGIHFAYNVGAYVIELVPELPSVIVTTDSDVINPFDYEISLREAVEVYGGRMFLAGDYIDSITRQLDPLAQSADFTVGTVITFNIIWGGQSSVIELDPNKKAITFSNNLSIYGKNAADSNNRVTVKTASGAEHRLFTADSSTANWNLGFYDLIMTGGTERSSNGGAIYMNGATSNLTLDNVEITNSKAVNGGGVYVTGTGILTILNSVFSDNGSIFSNNEATIGRGGAIFSSSNITVDNSTFKDNVATTEGGAIYMAPFNANLTPTLIVRNGSAFTGNMATGTGTGTGGAIHVSNGNLRVSGSSFSENSAHLGGAISVGAVTASTVDIVDSSFTSNTAWFAGGAIWTALSVTLNIGQAAAGYDVIFDSNGISGNTGSYGGAIYASDVLTLINSSFISNYATLSGTGSGFGGAIYAASTLTVTGGNFTGNAAGTNGGAIYAVNGGTFSGTADNNLIFNNNIAWASATNNGGGAIYSATSMTINSYVKFTGNRATSTTVSFNSGGGSGGAIFMAGGNLKIEGKDISFDNNVAYALAGNGVAVGGGAIYFKGSTLTITAVDGTIAFNGNQARYLVGSYYYGGQGGAICVAGGNVQINAVNAGDKILFDGNECWGADGGGAIFLGGSSITIGTNLHEGEVVFTKNIAANRSNGQGNGGAIFINSGTSLTILNPNTSFIGNQAYNYGGAIASHSGNVTIKGIDGNLIEFSGNEVLGNGSGRSGGGAIFTFHNPMTIDYCLFENNMVYKSSTGNEAYGGAIEVWSSYGDMEVRISNSEFSGNMAQFGGAIYAGWRLDSYIGQGKVTVTDCYFEGNRAVALIRSGSVVNENLTVRADGGAIALGSGTTTTVLGVSFTPGMAGMLTLAGKNEFINNSAASTNTGNGGAIYISYNFATHYKGSPVWNTNGILIFADNSETIFTGNKATNGGAIYLGVNGYLGLGSNCTYTFTGNHASGDGGAIYAAGQVGGKISSNGRNYDTTTELSGMSFTNNTANGNGGAVYTTVDLNFVGNMVFKGNQADFDGNGIGNGGAIYVASGATVTLGNTAGGSFTFGGDNLADGNTAANGGALYLAGNLVVKDNVALAFSNNRAIGSGTTGNGGAIYTLTTLSLVNTSSLIFTTNTARLSGGAIYASNATLALKDAEFGGLNKGNKALNGSGGAIYYSQTSASGTQNMSLNNVNFYYNSAYQNGGAVYYSNASTTNGTLTINGLNFSANSTTGGLTSHGGAIYMAAGALLIADTGSVMSSFTSNSAAGNGGAIAMAGGTTLNVSSGILGRLTFWMNQAVNGGAIAAENASVTLTGVDFGMDGISILGNQATSGSGGAIYFVQTSASGTENLSLNNVNFYGNSAYQNGGAIHYSNANGTLTADGLSFIGNSTTGGTTSHGGAIYVAAGGLTVQGSATKFEDNVAAGNGGAIAMNNGTTLSVTGITFLRNSASNGGAIYSSSGAAITGVTFGDGTLANANTARTNGGAIYLDGTTAKTVTIDGTTRFNYNTAVTAGGAIWVGGNTTLNIGAASFTLNQATARNSKGGAIYAADSTVNLTGTRFGTVDAANSGNSATFGGAVYAATDDTVVVIDNVTFANNAAIEKGAIYDPHWTETGMGGALYVGGMATVTIGGNSLFTQNTAGSHGGAIYTAFYENTLVISDTLFTQNVAEGNGGAISGWATLELSKVNFGVKDAPGSGNKATGNYDLMTGFGGAIDSAGRIILVDCNFYRNEAKFDGGAIYAGYTTLDDTDPNENAITVTGGEFGNAFEIGSGNIALKQKGGAIYAGAGKVVTNNTNFYRNEANDGGAVVGIYVHTNGGEFGHATEKDSGNIARGDRDLGGGGGAIWTWWEVVANGTNFYRNEARYSADPDNNFCQGGAISGDQVTVIGCEFGKLGDSTSGNSAVHGSGGAIYASGDVWSTDSNYYYNSARDNGGAISCSTTFGGLQNTVTVNGGEFGSLTDPTSGNTAGRDGGAIYVSRPDYTATVTSNDANYYYNSAGRDGGAIYCAIEEPFYAHVPYYTPVWPDEFDNALSASVTINGGEFGNASIANSGNRAGRDGGAVFNGRLADINSVSSTDANYYYNQAGRDGGAIYGYDNVDVTGNIFRYNSASNNGGAIYVVGSLTVDSSIFYTNSAVNDGGAIYGEGEITLNNSTKFGDKNTAGTGNTAANGYGGAVYGKSTVTANGTEFYRNQANLDGGAIYGETKVVLESAVFGDKGITTSGNIANRDGGAVYAAGDVWANIVNAHHNRAGRDGGALYALSTGNVMLSNFTGNKAVQDGGAIYLAGTEVTMSNTLVADNSAGRDGGGIFSVATAATLINLTVANNVANGSGGGMWNTTAATVRNSIFWGNRAANMNQFNTGVANTVTYSGIEGWTLGGTGNVALQAANTGTNAKDKYYVWFKDADNADITKRNYNLTSNSYAINRGNNSDAVLPHDLNFADRIQYGYVDMGAYEAGSKGNIVVSADDKTIIYGNTGTLVAHSDVSGSFTFTTADGKYISLSGDQALALLANGQVTVNVEFISDDTANWNTATTTLTVTTVKRDITIAAKDATYDYDGQYHSLEWNGIIGGMGLAFDDFLDSYNSTDHRNAGKYTYSLTKALIDSLTRGNMSENYNITYEAATLTINQITLTITGESDSRTYDGAYHDYSYTRTDLVGNDYIKSIVDGDNSWRNANTYNNQQSGALIYNDLGEDVTGNYDIKYVAGKVVIDQAVLTIKGTSDERTYDGQYHDYSVGSVNGLVGDDRLDSVDGQYSWRNADTYENLQSGAVIKNSGNENMTGNYDIKYEAGEVVIKQAALTITGTSDERTYDGQYHDYSVGSVNGLVGDDRLDSVDGQYSWRNANTYENLQSNAVIKNSGNEIMTGNYSIKYVAGEVVIKQAELTITGTSDERTYDGQYHDYSVGSVNGLVGDDRLDSIDGQYSWRNADTYSNLQSGAVIKNSGNENMTGNYSIKYVAGEVVITKATITVTRDGDDKVYDGNTSADYQWSVTGDYAVDNVTYNKGTASFDDRHVGDNKNVNFIGDSLTGDLSNYDVVYVDKGADITPADLLIVIDDKGKVVGQADPAFTGNTTGLVGGDTAFGYNRTDKGEAVGKYGIDQYQLEDGNGGKNYNVTVVNGTLTITAAVVDEARINIYSDASSRRYVINGQHQASLINSLSTMTANRDVDAVLDTENSGSVGSASHQTSAKAESKMKTNLKETSQKKSFEDYDQQAVQQRTNSMLVKSGLFADKAEKSVLDSQYKVNDKAGGVQVQMPVNDFSGAQNTSFQSDHPMHTMPSTINIEAGGVNVVNFSGVELTDVTVMEKVENLKDALDLLLDEMLLV